MKLGKNKKQKTDQIIRIEELEALMQKYGDDLKPEDMEDIVSMYMPHRKRRKLGAALLRLDKLQLLLLTLMLVVCILFITAFMQEKMGNFTINLNRLELYRYSRYWRLQGCDSTTYCKHSKRCDKHLN